MKRLLIGPAIALAGFGALFGCSGPKVPEAPKVPREIPIDNFDQRFPPIPHTPPAVLPEPVRKPTDRHRLAPHKEKPHVRHVPKPAARPVPPELTVGAVEPLPPQQGVICIFPFNMIPNCTPVVP